MNLDLAAGLRLHLVEGFPDTLLSVPSMDLWHHLPGPTLFHVAGRHERPLFVSVLLHGNEDTGWAAVQDVLKRHRQNLRRSLVLLVGNLAAARANVRTLPGQIDYNRSWPGTPHAHSAEAHMMREVVAHVRDLVPFASIDIHNNTGRNPHYACVNRLSDPYLHLARLFSRTVVYFERPLGVQSAAMAHVCPAVTVECGVPGGSGGVAHAAEFLEAALALDHFPDRPIPEGDIDLLQTHAIIKVPPHATFSFDGSEADFMFRHDLDHLNFSELEIGTLIGRLGRSGVPRLSIESGGPAFDAEAYFAYEGDEIRLSRRAIPAMLTLDPRAVRLDCLGYLMHPLCRDGSDDRFGQ